MDKTFYPQISVIIPVYNGEEYLEECLECLEAQSYPRERFEILVVDNNSTDSSAAIMDRFDIVRLSLIGKQGAPAGRNAALAHAGGDILLFIDCDCMAPPDLLLNHAEKHLYFQASDPDFVAVGGGIRGRNPGFWALCDDVCSWFYFHYKLAARQEKLFCPTANISFLRSVFEEIGNFNEILVYGDDIDICQRIMAQGKKVFFEPSAYITHVNRPSFQGFLGHVFSWASGQQFMLRAGIRTVRKHPCLFYLWRIVYRFLGTLYYSFLSKRWYAFFLSPVILFAYAVDAVLIIKHENAHKRSFLSKTASTDQGG